MPTACPSGANLVGEECVTPQETRWTFTCSNFTGGFYVTLTLSPNGTARIKWLDGGESVGTWSGSNPVAVSIGVGIMNLRMNGRTFSGTRDDGAISSCNGSQL